MTDTSPTVTFVIISQTGALWTGERWSHDHDDALMFTTNDAANKELLVAQKSWPQSYVSWFVRGRGGSQNSWRLS
jgi:hypothetical protein